MEPEEEGTDTSTPAPVTPPTMAATEASSPLIAQDLIHEKVLQSIENPGSHPDLPINILTAISKPQAAEPEKLLPMPPSPALVNRLMTAPIATANENVQKIAPPEQPAAPIAAPTPASRPGPDPYHDIYR